MYHPVCWFQLYNYDHEFRFAETKLLGFFIFIFFALEWKSLRGKKCVHCFKSPAFIMSSFVLGRSCKLLFCCEVTQTEHNNNHHSTMEIQLEREWAESSADQLFRTTHLMCACECNVCVCVCVSYNLMTTLLEKKVLSSSVVPIVKPCENTFWFLVPWNPKEFYLEPKRFYLETKRVLLWGQSKIPFGTLLSKSVQESLNLQSFRHSETNSDSKVDDYDDQRP